MAPKFTKEMKKTHTIIVPNMSPLHFSLLEKVFHCHGYKIRLLDNYDGDIINIGLKYVHNDMCYPCLLVVGQIIDAIQRGLVDRDRCAVAITQTGGGCRASNYYYLLIKALEKAGLSDIPVISLNLSNLNSSPGFEISLTMLLQSYAAIIYGDLMMLLRNQVKPYEVNKGETDALVDKWLDRLRSKFERNKGYFWRNLWENFNEISDDFSSIEVNRVPILKVGIVGEIYMKYSTLGNSDLEGFLQKEGAEIMLPPLNSFLLYALFNRKKDYEYYGKKPLLSFMTTHVAFPILRHFENWMHQAIQRHPEFTSPLSFDQLTERGERFIDLGCKMGEGWLLTAEMAELIEKGYPNIVCTQPFGCLPNHIVGKSKIRVLKEHYPKSNIVAIDYDPSETKVNQENRIKLMLAVGRENLGS